MAKKEHLTSAAAVLGSHDLVGEILVRLESSKEMIRCGCVSPLWRAVTKGAAFRRLFGELHDAAHLGFLVEMQEGPARIVKLMYGHGSEDSAVAIREHIEEAVLGGDDVLSSRKGLILTNGPGESYCTSSPIDFPRVYTVVAPKILAIPRDGGQHTVNTFGQFAVVPNAVEGSEAMAFFVRDASRSFVTCYDGVTFCSCTNIFFHVCVHDAAIGWVRFVSDPFQSPEAALFHRNPYSVIVANKLYLMYVVGYIVCFDLITKSFTHIPLPEEVKGEVRSWYDYTVASHRGGGLVLVHYHEGILFSWVLSFVDEAVDWTLQSMVDLVQAFGDRVSSTSWHRVLAREAFPIGSDNFFTVQARKASSDARFVLLTFGFNLGMFEVDMINSTVHEITNAVRTGLLGRMYALSEPWPANA